MGLALGLVLALGGIQFDQDVSDSLRNQVNGDLQFIESVTAQKQSPLHQQIFGNLNGQNYIQWFGNRVQFFGLSDCGGPGAVACTTGVPNKIWVTDNYTGSDYPQIARIMTLFHEARHTEVDQDNWPHAKCPLFFPYRSIWTGARLGGKAACDITTFGSYGSASIMLNNISKFCTNCSDKVKTDATLYSDDQSKRLVNSDASQQLQTDFQYE